MVKMMDLECSICHFVPAKEIMTDAGPWVVCDECYEELTAITCIVCGEKYNEWKMGDPLECPKCRKEN